MSDAEEKDVDEAAKEDVYAAEEDATAEAGAPAASSRAGYVVACGVTALFAASSS